MEILCEEQTPQVVSSFFGCGNTASGSAGYGQVCLRRRHSNLLSCVHRTLRPSPGKQLERLAPQTTPPKTGVARRAARTSFKSALQLARTFPFGVLASHACPYCSEQKAKGESASRQLYRSKLSTFPSYRCGNQTGHVCFLRMDRPGDPQPSHLSQKGSSLQSQFGRRTA